MGNKISKCDGHECFEKRSKYTKKNVLVKPKMPIEFEPDKRLDYYELSKPMVSKRG